MRRSDAGGRYWSTTWAYAITLLMFLAASQFPALRVWGINWWAYFSSSAPLLLFGTGVAGLLAVALSGTRRPRDARGWERDRTYFAIVCPAIAVFGLAFYLLRTRTHFLGDGYTLLTLLGQARPLLKTRELGEALAHVWIKGLAGGSGEAAALISYRVISIGAGVICLGIMAWGGWRLFGRFSDRLLFTLGLATGGYMLLFFGYVENYSLFVMTVMAYSLAGLMTARGAINLWVPVLLQVLAVLLHVLGLALLPATFFLVLMRTGLWDATRRARPPLQMLAGLFLAAVPVAVFAHQYTTSYFFRLAFVPLFPSRFTVDGYTLFSAPHLADCVNLIFLLVPSILVLGVAFAKLPLRRLFKKREYRFLVVLVASTLGAVFTLDPKLGMPRDWDLFSFAGVPLTILGFYSLVANADTVPGYRRVVAACLILSGLLLFPRVASQMVPTAAISHLRNYMALDRVKSRSAYTVLSGYYEAQGDMVAMGLITDKWEREYPEMEWVHQSHELLDSGRYQEAMALNERAIKVNPIVWGAYSNLGRCLLELRQWDSALTVLQIAAGLNPHSATIYSNLGYAWLWNGEYDKAEHAWVRSIGLDSTLLRPRIYLTRLYKSLNRQAEYRAALAKLGARDDAPLMWVKELADVYLNDGKYEEAAGVYERAIRMGLDSTYLESLRIVHPQLSP